MMRFPCSECGKNLRLAKRMDGKTITCPSCRKAIVVPLQLAEEADAEPAPPTRLKAANDPSSILDRLPANLPAEIKQLGAPVALYKGSVLFTIAMMYIGAALLLLGPALACNIGCGGILLALGILMIVGAWQDRNRRVAVFTNGLVHVRGQTADVIPWSEIESVWQKITDHYDSTGVLKLRTTYLYTIQERGEDETIVLGEDLNDIKTLGETIQEEVTRVQLPGALAAFKRGETLTFGPLTIDTKGLAHEQSTLAWSEIKGLKVDKGVFHVLKKGNWFTWTTVTVDQIPNLMVFLALVDGILGINQPPK